MTEHTALPWHHVVFINQDRDETAVVHWEPAGSACLTLGKMELKPADAEFIARACNAHEDMLHALRMASQGCPCTLSQRDSGHLVGCFVPEVQEAIAKAEGRS